MENEEIKLIKDELEKCKKERDDYLDGWKRAKADLINYKKDEDKARAEFGRFFLASSLLELLKIKDSFNEAIRHLEKEGLVIQESDWVKGVKKINEQLDQYLTLQGLEEIKALGEKFNPEFHESIGEICSENNEDETILKEIQKGYKLFGRVLRPSKVKINKKLNK